MLLRRVRGEAFELDGEGAGLVYRGCLECGVQKVPVERCAVQALRVRLGRYDRRVMRPPDAARGEPADFDFCATEDGVSGLDDFQVHFGLVG